MRYYFASKCNFDGITLTPRVPLNRMYFEDNSTKRICVSQSITGCLSAVGGFVKDDIVFIHICECEDEYIMQPTVDDVPDVCFTGEVWILRPVEMNLYMTIQIQDYVTSRLRNLIVCNYSFDLVGDGDELYNQEMGVATFNSNLKYEKKMSDIKKEIEFTGFNIEYKEVLEEYNGIKL